MTRGRQRLLLVLGATLAALAAAEIALRLLSPAALEPGPLQRGAGAEFLRARMLVPVERDGLRYAGRPHGRVEVLGIPYRHDARGLRTADTAEAADAAGPGPADPDAATPDGARELRVVLLGDSNVYGWGVPFEESLANALATELAARTAKSGRPRRPVVTPLAFPGYNSADQLALAEALWSDLAPELVIVCWFANDREPLGFHVDADGYLFSDPLPVPEGWKPTLWRSRLYRGLSHLRSAALAESGALSPSGAAAREASAEGLRGLARLARTHDVPFVVAEVPVLEDDETRAAVDPAVITAASAGGGASGFLSRLAAAEGWPLVSLLPAVTGRPARELWAGPERGDHHPNGRAHALFADVLAEYLLHHDLLP